MIEPNVALVMERLLGPCKKLDEPGTKERGRIVRLFNLFYEVGVQHIGDASVFCADNPRGAQLIDFALRDVAVEYL